MTSPPLVRHLKLALTTPFSRATAIQDKLVRQHLDHKAQVSSSPPPPPTILTFSPSPVYTTGRRELGTLSPATISHLRKPLLPPQNKPHEAFTPEIHTTLRGGQITFHGPGQLVIYPILDLKSLSTSLWPKGITARCFVHILEQATINTLLKSFEIKGVRTGNPGVWINEEEKIAALGLHLRRNISSFGVGLNVSTDLRWFERIVACGLVGKKTVSIEEVLGSDETLRYEMELKRVAESWVNEFKRLVWGDESELKVIEADGDSITGLQEFVSETG